MQNFSKDIPGVFVAFTFYRVCQEARQFGLCLLVVSQPAINRSCVCYGFFDLVDNFEEFVGRSVNIDALRLSLGASKRPAESKFDGWFRGRRLCNNSRESEQSIASKLEWAKEVPITNIGRHSQAKETNFEKECQIYSRHFNNRSQLADEIPEDTKPKTYPSASEKFIRLSTPSRISLFRQIGKISNVFFNLLTQTWRVKYRLGLRNYSSAQWFLQWRPLDPCSPQTSDCGLRYVKRLPFTPFGR